MPLTDLEKRRINNSLTLESLRIEYELIAKQIQSQGFNRSRTDALLAQLNSITEARKNQLVSSEFNSTEKTNNQIKADQNSKLSKRTEKHFTRQDFNRFNELILHECGAVALQIYHPTNCELHCDADKRILRLKDGSAQEIQIYSEAISQVLPLHCNIFLACVPSSTTQKEDPLKEVIRRVARKSTLYEDSSSTLKTTRSRNKKSHGHKFSDDELGNTITVDTRFTSQKGVIVLLDDVVTSGQSFRVCTNKLRSAGIKNDILYLAMAKTDRQSRQEGIADSIHHQLTYSTLSHRQNTSEHRRPPGVDNAHRRERINLGASSKTKNPKTHLTRSAPNSQNKQASKSKDDCFVITAIYEGNFDHKNVQILRKWRDEKLIKSTTGRFVIDSYYKIGPTLALLVKRLHLTKPLRSILEKVMGEQP